MSAIQKLCNRGILLQNGQLVMTDSCQNAISQYLSARDQNEIIEKKPRQLNAFAFTKIYTADNTGIAKSEFAWSDPMSLRVELYCPEHPRQEELAISLYDARKNRIFSIHHPLAAEVNLSGNVITMQLDLPRQVLAPGQYSWLICVNHRGVSVTDLQNDVCAFTVSETGSPYSDYAIGSCGSICLECNVQKIKEEAYPDKSQ